MLKNIKIRQQINVVAAVVITLVIGLAAIYAIVLFQINVQSNRSNDLQNAALNAIKASLEVQSTALNTNAYALGNFDHREKFAENIVELNLALAALREKQIVLSDDERDALNSVDLIIANYVTAAEDLFTRTNTFFAADTEAEREAANIQQETAWDIQNGLSDDLDIILGDLAFALEFRSTAIANQLTQLVQAANVLGFILPIIVIVLTIFIMFTLRNTITQPLMTLTDATHLLGEGNYTVRASINDKNEFGELAESFNTMVSLIEERQNQLTELNQSLEKRVAERTADLKIARDEALAAQRIANENSRLKSEFLATMSHELRTPMNAIEGYTGIILDRMAGTDYNQQAERYLHKVKTNSERLLNIINDFLDLSRIESGRLELAHLPISPIDMVQKWQESLSGLADTKGLQFDVHTDPNLPRTIYGDEELLSKIAINLVGNAIKFTEKGTVKLSLERSGQQMILSVSDTGIGIPPHAREYIFDEFRQVDQSSKRKHGGTGLGLAIVQKLVRAMGGTITLQSEVGVGSTFTVLVPLEEQEKQFA